MIVLEAILNTARAITLTGEVTGAGNFDGSGNLDIETTVRSIFFQPPYYALCYMMKG